jgi:hypothetical protein
MNPASSHVLRLAAQLLALGIFENGSFCPIHFRHDDGCKTLRTASSFDCFCNCEAVISGERYSFDDYVKNAEHAQ